MLASISPFRRFRGTQAFHSTSHHTYPAHRTILNTKFSYCPQATLAAANVAMRINGHPAYNMPDVLPYVDGELSRMPQASPSIVNAKELSIATGL